MLAKNIKLIDLSSLLCNTVKNKKIYWDTGDETTNINTMIHYTKIEYVEITD